MEAKDIEKLNQLISRTDISGNHKVRWLTDFIDNRELQQQEEIYSEEEVLAFGKSCFYKGFEKAENDDANCFTAFREEIGILVKHLKKK